MMRRTRSLVSRLMEGLSLQVRDTVEGETPAAAYPALPKGVPLRADFPRPGEDVTVGDKRGNLARERLRGFVLIFVFLHKMFCGQGFPLDKRANVSYYI